MKIETQDNAALPVLYKRSARPPGRARIETRSYSPVKRIAAIEPVLWSEGIETLDFPSLIWPNSISCALERGVQQSM
jgi:hypothetical protein